MNNAPGQFDPPAVDEKIWLDFLLGERQLPGLTPPPMPAVELQNKFVGSNGRAAMTEAVTFCSKLVRASAQFDGALNANKRLLDFGVGWGRLYRILLNHIKPQNLIGVDIDANCIELCKNAMPYGTFRQSETLPPLSSPTGDFDIVYAYSVFSHLAEHAFKAWVQDFVRLLKPHGLLLFTTLKGAHLEVWRRHSLGDHRWYLSHLEKAGFNYEQWQQKAAGGEFLYVPTGGGDMRDGSFYGESIVSRKYLERVCPGLGFAVRIFEDGDDLPQSFVVLQKTA